MVSNTSKVSSLSVSSEDDDDCSSGGDVEMDRRFGQLFNWLLFVFVTLDVMVETDVAAVDDGTDVRRN